MPVNLYVCRADQALNTLWRGSAAVKLSNKTDSKEFTMSLHCSSSESVSYNMHTIPPSIPSTHPSVSINPALQEFSVSTRYSAPLLEPFAFRYDLCLASCPSSLTRSSYYCKFWLRNTNRKMLTSSKLVPISSVHREHDILVVLQPVPICAIARKAHGSAG